MDLDPYQRSERRADNDIPELETVADLVDALKEAVPDLMFDDGFVTIGMG